MVYRCAIKSVTLIAEYKAQSKVQKGTLLMLAFVENVCKLRTVTESQGNNNFLTFKDMAAGLVVSKFVEKWQWVIL